MDEEDYIMIKVRSKGLPGPGEMVDLIHDLIELAESSISDDGEPAKATVTVVKQVDKPAARGLFDLSEE